MSKKLPFMPFYVNDYLSDTTFLTCEEHGAYLLLLITMWKNEGQLPSDDVALSRIARLPLPRWKKMRSNIIAFFEVAGNTVTHKRLVEELNHSRVVVKARSESGKLGAAAKSLKNKDAALANADVLLEQKASEQKAVHTSYFTEEAKLSKGDVVSAAVLTEKPESKAALCVEIGKKITDAMGVTDDPRWLGNWSSVSVWIAKGYDPELDILPTVLATIDRMKRSGKNMPGSLNYFEKAIAENYRRRTENVASIQKPNAEIVILKRGTFEFNQWISHYRKQGKSTVFLEKQKEISVPSKTPPTEIENAINNH